MGPKFKPPTEKERSVAIGLDDGTLSREGDGGTSLHNFLKCSVGCFDPIHEPSEGDWLDEFHTQEEAQPYHLFEKLYRIKDFPVLSKYSNTIYLVPIGTFKENRSPNLDTLVAYVSKYFCLPTKLLDPLYIQDEELTETQQKEYKEKQKKFKHLKKGNRSSALPKLSYLVDGSGSVMGQLGARDRDNKKRDWKQYLTTDIHNILTHMLPVDGFCIVGVMMEDLYSFGMGWVYGEALIASKVAVFSFYRHSPLYGTTEYNTKDLDVEQLKLLFLRSCKTVVHEIGHLFGIDHCRYYQCLMNGANHEEESDRTPLHLCPIDLRKLHRQVKFDVQARYESLRDFYTEVGFTEEASWVIEILIKFEESKTQTTIITTTTKPKPKPTTQQITQHTVLRCTVTMGKTTKTFSYQRSVGIDGLITLACEKLCIKNGRLQDCHGEEVSDIDTLLPDCKLVLVKCKK